MLLCAVAGFPGTEAHTECLCCLCREPLRDAVSLTPCGHSFCAACLGLHLSAALQAGLAPSCPMRWVDRTDPFGGWDSFLVGGHPVVMTTPFSFHVRPFFMSLLLALVCE